MDKIEYKSRFNFNRGQESTKKQLVLPILLASLTGVVLGVCLLILFKSQAAQPIVETIPAPQAAAGQPANSVYGAAELPGVSLTVWQVGVFSEQAKVEQERTTLAQKGVTAVPRGTGPIHLFAGAAPDKKAGEALGTKLTELKVNHFVKEYGITPLSGVIEGVPAADAKQIERLLSQEVKIAEALLKADSAGGKALRDQWSALAADAKTAGESLVKGGQQENAAALQLLHQQLGEAAAAAHENKGVLDVQGRLIQFFVSYEILGAKLVKIR
ncbi:hypothetical protein OS242_15735 [Tumebacillus sp. DT12]|uniref:SPOR domain-containing protein n=1 Tax=Tumebacillus lacus TaxID=2995335 RepID=A0ABT3X6Y4_9BACL|nr:hypothetical protein [Tumebacillus lacus]MCX7571401.1 hypothetical protein [Tumebacillus lacus]